MHAPTKVNKTIDVQMIPVVQEQMRVSKQKRATGRVAVQVVPVKRTERVDLALRREKVEVERVKINKPVEKTFAKRREGDTTIIPIFEEVLVVQKRLMLKEEIRITRRRTSKKVRRQITLRRERVRVKRTKL